MFPVNLSIEIGGVKRTATPDQPLRDHQQMLEAIGIYLVRLKPNKISRNEVKELVDLMQFLYERSMFHETNLNADVKSLIDDGLVKSSRLLEIMPIEVNNIRKEPMSAEALELKVKITDIIIQLAKLLSIGERKI
jgi:hypothetical protein